MEQFLFGLMRDGNYTFLKSPGLNQLLSDVNIQYLRQKRLNNGEPYWLPTEQVVAIQYIKEVKDDSGRVGVWNSTLLFPIDEYIRETYPYKRFSRFFIKREEDTPLTLKTVDTGGE